MRSRNLYINKAHSNVVYKGHLKARHYVILRALIVSLQSLVDYRCVVQEVVMSPTD